MAAAAGRSIAIPFRFRAGCSRLPRIGLSHSRAGLSFAALEVFPESSRQPGFFCGIRRIGLFVHKVPVSRLISGFKLCLRGTDPYGKPCPRGAARTAI